MRNFVLAITLCAALGFYGCAAQGSIKHEAAERPSVTVYDDEGNRCADVGTLARTDIGDEFVSLTNLLDAYCNDVKVGDVYLSFNFGDSDLDDFIGDPVGDGYALPSATVVAANNYMAYYAIEIPYRASNESGVSWEDAKRLVNDGIPTLVWLTENLSEPSNIHTNDGDETIYDGMLTYIVVGASNGVITMISPTQGVITAQESTISELYGMCGQKLVVMRKAL